MGLVQVNARQHGEPGRVDSRTPAWHGRDSLSTLDEIEAAAREAAGRAGQIIRERFGRSRGYDAKSSAIDLVTATDRDSEAAILEVLREAFPGHAFLAEESGAQGEADQRWLIDPLDGTTNFAHGYPQVSVSIAYQQRGETQFGLVLDPLREEIFTARAGGGARLSGEAIHVSPVESLDGALLATGFPYDRRQHADFYLSFFKAFMERCHGLRRAGSAALDLCFVAAARVEGFWEWNLQAWDVAAGALIVTEAGGTVSDFDRGLFDPFARRILASNGRLHEAMSRILCDVGLDHPDGPRA